jgi:hypothetical protein
MSSPNDQHVHVIKAPGVKTNLISMARAVIAGLLLLTLTGCATVVGALGTGFAMAAEYVLVSTVSKTITYEFGLVKKALLVALRRMEIPVESAARVPDGEEIFAKTDTLVVKIQLKRVTPTVTSMKVKAERSFVTRDRATAQEIVNQTQKTAEKLAG